MQKKPVKDVFGFWQLKGADLSGKYEIPVAHGTSKIPESLVLFTDCEKEAEPKNKAVHFYQLDENFVGCLSSEAKFSKKLETFRKYRSVILPDSASIEICHWHSRFFKYIKADWQEIF